MVVSRIVRQLLPLLIAISLVVPASRAAWAQSATPIGSPVATSADWPMYRGNAARTGVTTGAGPISAPAQRWRAQVQGGVHSAPAVVAGQVFVGSDDKNLHAFDAATGQEQWRFATKGAVESSPAVVGGLVYFGSNDKNLYALDAKTGAKVWQFPAARADASPAVADGVVYAGGADLNLYALDAITGHERWRAPVGGATRSPAVADGLVVVGGGDGRVHALDQATGQERWQFALTGGTITTPVIANGMVYDCTVEGDHNHLYALDATTGTQRWTFALASGKSIYVPVVTADTLYAGSDDGKIYAIDAATGQQRWQFTTGGRVTATGALAGDLFYMPSADHTLYALHAGDGTEAWRVVLDGAIDFGPAIANGVAYLGTALGGVYAIGGSTPAALAAPAATPAAASATTSPVAFLWQSAGGGGGLQTPTDLAIDPQGRLWVTEGGAGRFQIFNPDGTFIEAWGLPGSGDGQFNFIRANGDAYGGIEFAPDGSFYVLDTGNQRVQQFDANRTFIRSWTGTGVADGAFKDPMGMSRAPDGTVLVLDDVRGEIDRFSSDGKFLDGFSSHPDGAGGLNSANDLTTDAQGNVYLSALEPDKTKFRIDEFDPTGKLLATMGTADLPDQAVALDVDAAGRIFVTSASEVLVFGPDGKLVTRWGSFGSGPGQITGPGGIILDGQGDVYVADYDGNRIQKFQLLPPLAPGMTATPAA